MPDSVRCRVMRARLRWIPNALTAARLVALPVLVVVLATAGGPTSPLAAGIFGAVAFTDFLDGILARRLGAESRFGRIADPLADRLLIAVGLVGVILLDRLHWAGPAILLARDALGMAGFAWFAARGVELRVDLAGKTSSALVMVATGGALLLDAAWVDWLFWAAVVAAVLTLANYARTVAAGGGRAAPSSTSR